MEDSTMQTEELVKVKEYFDKIMQFVRYSKTKDEIIEKTGKDIQRYRDGFALSAYKPLANAVILLREACKKELDDLDKYEYDVAKLKKNFDFLVDDVQDLILENGVEETEKGYAYCGKDLFAPLSFGEERKAEPVEQAPAVEEATEASVEEAVEAAEAPAQETAPETQGGELEKILTEYKEQLRLATEQIAALTANVTGAPVQPAQPAIDWEKTLAEYQEQIVAEIAKSDGIDKEFKKSFDNARIIDTENKLILILPVLKKLAHLKGKLAENLEKFPVEEENCKEEYKEILSSAIQTLCDVLEIMGVKVETQHPENDTLTAGFHQLMKAIPTEVEEDDRKIARIITDAYTLEGKVIYPQKVEVYKFKK